MKKRKKLFLNNLIKDMTGAVGLTGERNYEKSQKSIDSATGICFHFFRALGLLIETVREKDEFTIIEEPQFTTNGVMFNICQGNTVINVENVKKTLDKIALMGLNMLMLYAEDSYEVEGEPYFGYMRGRYSHAELKELDDYAYELGIEMIPCIQTLAQ